MKRRYSILGLSGAVAWILLAAWSHAESPSSGEKSNNGLAPAVGKKPASFLSVDPAVTNAGQGPRAQGIILTNQQRPPKASTASVPPPTTGTTASGTKTNATVLDLYWGGLPLGSHCTVKSDGLTVTYDCRPVYANQTRGKLIPSQAAWEKFWKAMEEVHLWKWKNRYNAPRMPDGLVWGLAIKHGDQQVRSSGHNAYPTLDTNNEVHGLPSETFKKYQRAVEELMGRKVWE